MNALFVVVVCIGLLKLSSFGSAYFKGNESFVLPLTDSSEEFGRLDENNVSFREYFRESRRLLRIHAFVQAIKVIRDVNVRQFRAVRLEFPPYRSPANETWKMYITHSQSAVAQYFRKYLHSEEEYHKCSFYLTNTYFIANRHYSDHEETVRVMSQLRGHTKRTLNELLRDEKPEHLFTTEHMKYSNMLAESIGEVTPVPYELFWMDEMSGAQYVIPLILGTTL